MSQEKCCFKGIFGLFVRGTPGFSRGRRRLCGFACLNFLLGIKLGELCDRCVSSISSLIGARAKAAAETAAAARTTTTKRTKRNCGNSSKKQLFKKVSDFQSRQLFLRKWLKGVQKSEGKYVFGCNRTSWTIIWFLLLLRYYNLRF